MKKLHQVHMLPTDNVPIDNAKRQLWLLEDGKMFYYIRSELASLYRHLKGHAQYLYFTSDEEIKAGDWYIFFNVDESLELRQDKNDAHGMYSSRKVVATTNPELWHTYADKLVRDYHPDKMIAHIPLSFVEEYVKQQGIKEVMLEMVDNGHEVDMEGRGGMDAGDTCWMEKLGLKLTPSGEAIWSLKEEKMYTKAEVREIAWSAWDTICTYYRQEDKLSHFNRWFDRNYPR